VRGLYIAGKIDQLTFLHDADAALIQAETDGDFEAEERGIEQFV
jgi:hypothetical protein